VLEAFVYKFVLVEPSHPHARTDPIKIVFAGIDGTGEARHQISEGNLGISVFHTLK